MQPTRKPPISLALTFLLFILAPVLSGCAFGVTSPTPERSSSDSEALDGLANHWSPTPMPSAGSYATSEEVVGDYATVIAALSAEMPIGYEFPAVGVAIDPDGNYEVGYGGAVAVISLQCALLVDYLSESSEEARVHKLEAVRNWAALSEVSQYLDAASLDAWQRDFEAAVSAGTVADLAASCS